MRDGRAAARLHQAQHHTLIIFAPLETLYRHVPRALVDRPKMGFSAPVEAWVRGELRDWAEALMSREALSRHGLLDVKACRRLWEGFAHRGRGWDRAIWNLLMFQAWYATIKGVQSGRPSSVAGDGAAPRLLAS